MRHFLSCLSLAVLAAPLSAQDTDPIAILERITKTVCVPIPLEGKTITMEATASARAGLSNLFKSLADAGLDLSGKVDSSSYVNVLHEELDGQVNAQRACNLQVYSDFAPLINDWARTQSSNTQPGGTTNTITSTGDNNANAAGTGNSIVVNQ